VHCYNRKVRSGGRDTLYIFLPPSNLLQSFILFYSASIVPDQWKLKQLVHVTRDSFVTELPHVLINIQQRPVITHQNNHPHRNRVHWVRTRRKHKPESAMIVLKERIVMKLVCQLQRIVPEVLYLYYIISYFIKRDGIRPFCDFSAGKIYQVYQISWIFVFKIC